MATNKKKPAQKPVETKVTEEKKEPKTTVSVEFPLDPTRPRDEQYFEINFDCKKYIFPRGETVEVPVKLYEIIQERSEILRRNAAIYNRYRTEGGADLT